ncbi:hypothetical protein [Streptosporangium saharense]|uniref:hypothetical protein n=1 Tax=Streptosporangium saharense TaxID=1706840 RepID=UPI003420A317
MGILSGLEALLARRNRSALVPVDARLDRLLPSSSEDLFFRARIELTWSLPRGTEPAVDTETFADAARRAASTFSVLHREEAESMVNLKLSQVETFPRPSRVRARLHVDAEITEFARERMLRDLETERYREVQQAGVSRLTALRDTMLRDGPTARLWWLNSDPGKLLELARHGDEFEKAIDSVSAGRGGGVEAAEAPVAELIRLFLADLGPEYRQYLLQQIERVFRSYERHGLADRLVAISVPPRDGLENVRDPADMA